MPVVMTYGPATPSKPATSAPAKSSLRLEARGPSTRPLAQAGEPREVIERELDRVQHGLLAERAAFGQQLNWLMLSQALLLNAFLLVLVFGWSTPFPAKRALLAGLALFAAAVAILIVLVLRGTRDAVISLHELRKTLETRLHKEFQRTPVFAPRALVTRGLASAANGLLPLMIVAGWIALSLYALAAPFTTAAGPDSRLGAPTSAPDAQRSNRATQTNRPLTSASQKPPAQAAAGEHAEPEPVAAAHRSGGFKW